MPTGTQVFIPSEGPSHHKTGQYQAHARGWGRKKVPETKGYERTEWREKQRRSRKGGNERDKA